MDIEILRRSIRLLEMALECPHRLHEHRALIEFSVDISQEYLLEMGTDGLAQSPPDQNERPLRAHDVTKSAQFCQLKECKKLCPEGRIYCSDHHKNLAASRAYESRKKDKLLSS